MAKKKSATQAVPSQPTPRSVSAGRLATGEFFFEFKGDGFPIVSVRVSPKRTAFLKKKLSSLIAGENPMLGIKDYVSLEISREEARQIMATMEPGYRNATS